MKETTIYLGGFSKSYAMTGRRQGYACGNKYIIVAMTTTINIPCSLHPSTPRPRPGAHKNVEPDETGNGGRLKPASDVVVKDFRNNG
jgi:hypothetical protein